MCKLCSQAIRSELKKRHWKPKDKEVMDFLWQCTAFPCADGPTMAKQIKGQFRRFGRRKTWASFYDAAMAAANKEMRAAVKRPRPKGRSLKGN